MWASTALLACIVSYQLRSKCFDRTSVGFDVAIVADVFFQGESWKVKILDDLDWLRVLPQVLQVVSCPAV